MINSNCSNTLQASTSNNLHEASTSELTSNKASVNNQNRIANFNGFNIIEFPPEIHMEMCKYLDSQSMKELRRTCTRFRDNVSMVDVRYKESLENELREALGAGSQTSCERIHSLRKKGATIPLGELTPFLRGALRMESSDGAGIAKALWQMGATIPLGELTPFLRRALRMESSDGVTIAKALRYMGATLPPEDLPQTLREVLRLNDATAVQGNAKLLQEMGATLPHEELADELRGALRTDNFDAPGRVTAILRMGVTLPPVELPEFLQLAVAMQSPVGMVHAWAIKHMMGVLPQI